MKFAEDVKCDFRGIVIRGAFEEEPPPGGERTGRGGVKLKLPEFTSTVDFINCGIGVFFFKR